MSVGIATVADEGAIFYDALLKEAEKALAEVVERGGNGCQVHLPPGGDGSGS